MSRWKWATRIFAWGTAVGAIFKLNFFSPHDRWDESLHSHIIYGRYPTWMGATFGVWTSNALDRIAGLGFLCVFLLGIDVVLAFSGRESWRAFLWSALAYVVSFACSAAFLLSALSGLR